MRYAAPVLHSIDQEDPTNPLSDPERMVQRLERLATPEDFWEAIRPWVSPEHLSRRRAYYDAHFARERIARERQVFWLAQDFYGDVAFHDEHFRAHIGAPPLAQSPFPSRVAFEDYLAGITALHAWPAERMAPFVQDSYEVFADLATMGAMAPATALDRLKEHARLGFGSAWHPPVLLVS